jgi:hypothetical protein
MPKATTRTCFLIVLFAAVPSSVTSFSPAFPETKCPREDGRAVVRDEALDCFLFEKIQWYLRKESSSIDEATKATLLDEDVGQSAEVREALKRVARSMAKNNLHPVTMYALHLLARWGEPKEYFMDNAMEYESMLWLAYSSISILARDPNKDMIDFLKSIERDLIQKSWSLSRDHIRLRGPIGAANLVYRIHYEDYINLASIEEKVLFLARRASVEESISAYAGLPHPVTIWAQQQLLALSAEAPVPVAQCIVELEFSDPAWPRQPDRARYVLAQYLVPGARGIVLDWLDAAGFEYDPH